MEEFRKKVEKRLRFYTAVCLCSLAVYSALNFFTKGASDFAQGLTIGIFCGMEVVAVYNLARMFAAVQNKDKLKEMYINETDKRNIAIQKETSQKGSLISMLGTAAAAIVSGFFDEKVCITLAAAILFSALVNIIVNAYYNKKM